MEWFFKNNVAQANCHRSSGNKHETNNTLAPQRRSHYIVSQTTCTCTDTHSWLRKIPTKILCHTVYGCLGQQDSYLFRTLLMKLLNTN